MRTLHGWHRLRRVGGYGRRKVESCRCLDVNDLKRGGCLEVGQITTFRWGQKHSPSLVVSIAAFSGSIRLLASGPSLDGRWRRVGTKVDLHIMPCHFGGVRPFFICPEESCERRTAKLYGVGPSFRCRICHRLSYQSQSECGWHPAMRRIDNIRRRLGVTSSDFASFPARPPRMWRRNYRHLRAKTDAIERLANARLAAHLEPLIDRLEAMSAEAAKRLGALTGHKLKPSKPRRRDRRKPPGPQSRRQSLRTHRRRR